MSEVGIHLGAPRGQLPGKDLWVNVLPKSLAVCHHVCVHCGKFPVGISGDSGAAKLCVSRGHSAGLLGVRELGRRVGWTWSSGMRAFAKIKMFPIAVSR